MSRFRQQVVGTLRTGTSPAAKKNKSQVKSIKTMKAQHKTTQGLTEPCLAGHIVTLQAKDGGAGYAPAPWQGV
jgi:hypothetical protein